ncbi:MAG: molybdopterin-dependent oxidoreductase, partial [Streptosporangiaceae bacterium]
MNGSPARRRDGRRTGLGAVAGVLAAAIALGVGQLVAGITGASSSPVVAVGQLQIDFTPPWLKNFAITEFGSDDKLALVSGIVVVLAIFAAVIGAAATRRLAYGMAGLALFAAVGLIAAVTRPAASVADVLPTLFATVAAAVALRALINRIGPPAVAAPPRWKYEWDAGPSLAPGPEPATGPVPALDDQTDDGFPVVPDLPPRPGQPAGQGRTGPPGGVIRPAAADRGDLVTGPGGAEPARRGFLAASLATAGIAGVAGLAGRLLTERSSVTIARQDLHLPKPSATVPALPPGVNLDIPGLSPFITSNNSFYRVDTAIVLPQVAPSSWQLRIHGMVDREITLTFDELLKRPLIEDYITLCCVSNPVAGPYIGNALWLGTKLSGLLREAGIQAGADQLLCTSVDGFTSGTPVATVMDGRDALLAVAMNGQPLPVAHGFPARMVVPGLYGYVSATKWVTDIEVTTFASNFAYWAQRGWSQQAPIKTE